MDHKYDHQINRYRHRFLHERFSKLSVTRAEAPYLIRIIKAKTIAMNDLISELPFHKSHTTRAIKQLVKDGYVIKEVNPEDKRAFILKPTEAGMRVGEEVNAIFKSWEELVGQTITDEERKVIDHITYKVYRFLKSYYHEEDVPDEIDD